MLQNLADLQKQINSGNQLTEIEGSRINSHKKNEKLNPSKKGFKPYHLLKKQSHPSQALIEPSRVMRENPRKPVQCWGCGGPHLRRNCPLENGNEGQVPNTQEAETMGEEARTIPNICVVLEDHQE